MGIFLQKGTGQLRLFLKALMSGLQYVNDLFFAYYSLKKYEVVFTGQIIYLKRYLNDQFDPIQRRIYILTSVGFFSNFYYRAAEDNGEYHYRVSEDDGPRLQRVNEVAGDADFTVYVPTGLIYDSVKMNAAVNKYKLDDKTFNIETY